MQHFLLLPFAGFLSKRIKLDQSTDCPTIYPFILEQGDIFVVQVNVKLRHEIKYDALN